MRIRNIVRHLSWGKLFFYSEALGVLLAWGLGLLVALDREPIAQDSVEPAGLAVVTQADADTNPAAATLD